ncbi:Reverse_transcriptase (RNA-dependent DNA polymerase) [Hexamita inflata]|uniref:Reverse transcriptase (RNA-dependent DNA polymerase) n=1 Tax=Hexamita inflata TaxID=28002 RepID=A0AA86QPX4_9EUKA|nr:Reverse transcriptase (RNA-dependent DNA polymerase) [Hexamita inflata]
MSFLLKAKALPVTLTMSSDGLQNLGFRFKEIKSTFFDLERQHNQDEIRKTQSYKLIANLRSLNIFQKDQKLPLENIKVTQIARNQITTMAIAQAALTFKCDTCNAYFSTYDILRHQDSVDHKARTKLTAESFKLTIDHVEQHNFLMINYAYPDIASIQNGVLFKCECGHTGLSALDILFHQQFNCAHTLCSTWTVNENQFQINKKPIKINLPKQSIEKEQQDKFDQPFQIWVNENKLKETPQTIRYIPKEVLIITPVVVLRQTQVQCEERIHAMRQKCIILPAEFFFQYTYNRIVELIAGLDVNKPIEAINQLLSSCRLKSSITFNSNYDKKSESYNPPEPKTEQQETRKDQKWDPRNPEVVEVIYEAPKESPPEEIPIPEEKITMFTRAFKAKVADFISEYKFSKALQAIENTLTKEGMEKTSLDIKAIEEMRLRQLAKLFPTPPVVNINTTFRPYKHTYFQIKEKEVIDALHQLDISKTCGASGLSNQILRKLAENGRFVKILANAFEILINDPKQISQILPLFEFRVALIPKDDGTQRPLAINETMINVLSLIMLNRRDIFPHKFCEEVHTMNSDAMLSCKKAARKLADRNIILSLDLASAYNNVTIEAIINGMETQNVPPQIQLFVIGLIQAQNCIETQSKSLVQGSVISSLLFAYAIDPVIRILKERFDCVNYADDTIVELQKTDTEEMALDYITRLFALYGMQINQKKCKSTANNNIVKFMGIKYSYKSDDIRTHLSTDILIVAKKYQLIVDKMIKRGLPRSTVLGLFIKCICAKCSWAIRVDDYNHNTIKDYHDVDEILARTFHNILRPPQIPAEDLDNAKSAETIQALLLLMSASTQKQHGFGLILPGMQFETVQRLLSTNKIDPRYKKLQHSIRLENEKKEYPGLTTNQDCFVAHTLTQDFDFDNIEFSRAVNILFNSVSISIPQRKCSLCQQLHQDSNHSIYCSQFSGLSIQRHNRTQYDLIASLPVKFQPKLSPTYGQFNTSKNKGIQDDPGSNKDPGKVLHAMGNADVMIIQKEKPHFFDMCVTQLGPSMQREFISKLETHANNYQVDKDQIHPIILSDQCTIHPLSLDKINTFCRTGQLLRSIARSILKSHGLRTRTYDEAVKKHAELTQLQHDYAAENNITFPQFENKDDDEVVISFDL